ncbi:MAG TPA: cellulose synthase operon protein YhjQ/BcsQ [Candidatus Sulfotelmatobacter sp.]|nr:cellulose synthase operon protein YhjQ/BcsQ [Candidatus Sulfotelmatobacter sp.]
MQTPREISENRAMHGIAVGVLTEDREHLTALQNRLEQTRLGRAVFTHLGFPASPTDTILRQLQDSRAEVVIIDISSQDPQRAIRAIELIRATTQQIAIFANGGMSQPVNIVSSMRAGAGEYLDHAAGTDALLEALTRFSSSRTRSLGGAGKARVFTFLGAKGGAGCTTAAVNTALALQQAHGDVVLLDFAPIGHAALHLNLRPQFGVLDALQNLHRMDFSLLDGLMTETKEGLHVLAGPQQPYPSEPTPGELARLFDLLVSHYRFVVVDASSRLDPTTRLLSDLSNAVLVVAQTDVVSLWSAGRIHSFLEEGTGRDRLRVILNRYKKIPGFSEQDVQQVTNCKVLWKVPNAFQAVSPSIDHGAPVVLQEGPEISRSFRALAETLASASSNSDGNLDLVYKQDDSRKKTPGRLNLSPIRAGQ